MFSIRARSAVLAAFIAIYWVSTVAQDEPDELLFLSSDEAYCLMNYGPLLLASDEDPVMFSVDLCFLELSVVSESDVAVWFRGRDQDGEGSGLWEIPERNVIVYRRPEESDSSHNGRGLFLASERMPSPPFEGFVPVDPCEAEDCLEIDREVLECFLRIVHKEMSVIEDDPFILRSEHCEN